MKRGQLLGAVPARAGLRGDRTADRVGFVRRSGLSLLAVLACCGTETVVYEHAPFATDPPAVGPLAGKIVTTNNGDDTLSILDPAVPAAARRLPVGFLPLEIEGPHHIVADPQGRFVYLNLAYSATGIHAGPHGGHGSSAIPGFVLKLDAATGREAGRVAVDANPGDLAITADGKTVYVTHYDLSAWSKGELAGDLRMGDSFLVAVDTATMVVMRRVALCPAAHGVRVTADGTTLYATCGPDALAIVDLTDAALPVRRVQLPGTSEGGNCARCPYALGIAPDATVWVGCLGATGGSTGRGSIEIYDPTLPGGGAFDRKRRLDLRGSALFAAFAAAGTSYRVFVPEQGAGGDFVRVYSAGATGVAPDPLGEVSLTRDVCLNAHMLLVSPDGAQGHLVCEGDHKGPGSFVWLDLAGLAVRQSTPIGVFPDGLVLVPGAP